jgi:hypothetical protein
MANTIVLWMHFNEKKQFSVLDFCGGQKRSFGYRQFLLENLFFT